MLELRELSNKQKEQIKELQKDIDTYSCEVENVNIFRLKLYFFFIREFIYPNINFIFCSFKYSQNKNK